VRALGHPTAPQDGKTMAYLSFDHVQVAMPAGGEERARSFYRDVLGFAEVPQPQPMRGGGGVWFRNGTVELHLGIDLDFRPARRAHPALLVNDLDELAARCQAAGFAPTWDERYPGFRRFYLHDPFGNRIEILQPIDG
jgi:catechol 2,3-dioxygenase-like lactoylglutathione lyase family enzyme